MLCRCLNTRGTTQRHPVAWPPPPPVECRGAHARPKGAKKPSLGQWLGQEAGVRLSIVLDIKALRDGGVARQQQLEEPLGGGEAGQLGLGREQRRCERRLRGEPAQRERVRVRGQRQAADVGEHGKEVVERLGCMLEPAAILLRRFSLARRLHPLGAGSAGVGGGIGAGAGVGITVEAEGTPQSVGREELERRRLGSCTLGDGTPPTSRGSLGQRARESGTCSVAGEGGHGNPGNMVR